MPLDIEANLFSDIVILFAAAFVGSTVARLLRLPSLLGYLGVGMLVGPHALQLVSNVETVRTLAEFGVVLMLFAVGVEVSAADLRRLGHRVILAGTVQIVGTMAAGYGLGVLLGWPAGQAIVLGMVISVSSTMVVLKTLGERAELQTLHGRMTTGILLLQDLAFVPMIALLPALESNGGNTWNDLGFGVLKAVAVLVPVALLGGKVIPWVFRRVAGFGSHESFIVTVVAIALSVAAVAQWAGLSAALGAFVAGLVISETHWTGRRALQEITPLRDTFAALFFASLGMLTEPRYLADHAVLVVEVAAVVIGVKLLLTTVALRTMGYLLNASLLVGVALVQVGEFSFILAGVAMSRGIVDEEFLTLTVVVAVLTMAATPSAIGGGTALVNRLSRRIRLFRPYLPGEGRGERAAERMPHLHDHVVIAGMGRVGSFIGDTLAEHSIPFIGIDMDPVLVERGSDAGWHMVLGDSSIAAVLGAARTGYARLLVVTLTDSVDTLVTTQHAQRINAELTIVARVARREEAEALRNLGVAEIVWPEMEGGLGLVRYALGSYGAAESDQDEVARRVRNALAYGIDEDGGLEDGR